MTRLTIPLAIEQMRRNKMSDQGIAQALGLTLKDVQALGASKPAQAPAAPGSHETRDLQPVIVATWRQAGVLCWANANGGQRSGPAHGAARREGLQPGVPDLTAVHDGRLHLIEVKGPRTPVSDEQAAFALAAHRAGTLVWLIRAQDVADARQKAVDWLNRDRPRTALVDTLTDAQRSAARATARAQGWVI